MNEALRCGLPPGTLPAQESQNYAGSRLLFLTIPKTRKGNNMNITLGLTPLVSLIAGILILVMPRLLNFIVALYLIVIGLIGLFGAGNFHF
jgi:hypothetical protein